MRGTQSLSKPSIEATFNAAEQAGLRLAIKGRLVALLLLGLWMMVTRGPDRALDFLFAILLFGALGLCHYLIIGSTYDRKWVKYLFLGIDISLLTLAVAFLPPAPETTLPQIFTFRFTVFPFYFVILGIAAFSFSAGLVLFAGLFGAASWLAAFLYVLAGMQHPVDWSDIPLNPTKDQFLAVFLDENFVNFGGRIQEALIYLVVAILIAIVMRRARQTVRKQLETEQDFATVSRLFGRFVPEEVARTMIQDQGVLAPAERDGTVLFLDIAGFTTMTESKGPRAVVDTLNEFFEAATEIIGDHKGIVTQFQGDAVMAVFNVPLDLVDHEKEAFAAALALRDLARRQTFGGENLNVRIGLAAGPLVAGNVGGGGRQSYTVYGDTVNLAARLEALNKEYDTSLLMAESVAHHLPNDAIREIGRIEVRGFSEPIVVFSDTD